MKKIGSFFTILKKSIQAFSEDECMKLSASLSYYTIFSLAPVLIIVISLAGLFFGQEAVQGRVYFQINSLIGSAAAKQIQDIIANVQVRQGGTIGTIIGFAILIIGATGVFTEIQSSINYIWSIRAKPRKGILKFIFNRLISFSLVVSIGFILLVSLIINSLMDVMHDRLQVQFSNASVKLFYVLNIVIIFIVITALFTIVFKVLPDAKISWKDSRTGAAFTSFLFIIGKFLIGFYIGNSKLGITYGTAASVIVILVWVYYTSIILYLGAEFTKVYSNQVGKGIRPNQQAVYIVKTESIEISPAGSKERPDNTEQSSI
ncbi:YihY/virulence factor BrkB family protein [Sediminibacterium ginsengisoli]|uniref:Membrane protein n=1 Tax=Sediminibacterium ginsengisoli TaxID=413434 RepID=A0A1T4Q1H8_9BACT|nr:YihY/virulence factor BrkB family protein [Sediminibacterium ginsengisoli]SJZ97589.1 membrane protein [Sediminibacterium ginsengisoli]